MNRKPNMTQPPLLNVIGCGMAAGSLVRLWLEAGAVRVGAVLNRSDASARRAVERLGAGTAVGQLRDMPRADCWLIGSNDDQIASVAQALVDSGADLSGSLVFHLAGRFGADVLAPLQGADAHLAALHPVRSLTHAQLSVADFRGTACVAEGSAEAIARLEGLVAAIGGLWLPVRGVDRGLYHAAVSVISNVTKAVAWKTQNWLTRAGLPQETAATVTHQLLATTMGDLFRSGAKQSITGPIVRGDTRTIEAHLEALRSAYPADIDVYCVFIRTVLELAEERGDLDAATLARFDFLLRG